MITEDDVRAVALELPGSYEQASYGNRPSWRTAPRMFTWIREDPEALVVWVGSVEERDAMLDADPTTFMTTPHYAGQPILLVRLDQVDPDEARELVIESWRLRAPATLVRSYDAEQR
ncbi:MAG: MmcQ/YjbR family DNA-binding protein [Actinomycetota bacterium]|nr:MmcQ/YjbR family DNA-binding protein [Actinomycetota bacterium]